MEMHDNIGTDLTRILYQSELIKRYLPHNMDEVNGLLSVLIRDTEGIINDVHKVVGAVDKIDVVYEDFSTFLKEWWMSFFQTTEKLTSYFSKSGPA